MRKKKSNVNQLVSKLKEQLELEDNIIFAYLFGSQARGQPHIFSDIDIAIYLKTSTSDEYLRIFKKLAKTLENDFDLVVLNNAPPLLRHRVVYEGILLFCKDPDVHYRFVSSTLIEALDFKETYKIIINGRRKYAYAS